MTDKKHSTASPRPPPGLRDGNPHGEFCTHCVRLFQERHHRHRSRTKTALYRMSRGMRKAVMPGSMTARKGAVHL